jgi:RNA polymerase sigma-70 factor (ECF subfamily)
VALLRRRDPRGFDAAYAAYAGRIHAFVLRLSRRRDVADDVLQHTFLRLAERGPELRADSDLRAWLFTVARNAFLGQWRSSAAREDLHAPDATDALEALSSPPPDVEARLLLGDVERALELLRDDDRELLLLVSVAEMEPSQVAALLGVEPPALRQRLVRARSRLLKELEHLPPALGKTKRSAHE